MSKYCCHHSMEVGPFSYSTGEEQDSSYLVKPGCKPRQMLAPSSPKVSMFMRRGHKNRSWLGAAHRSLSPVKRQASIEGWALPEQVADAERGLDSVPSQFRGDSRTAPRRQAVWLSPFGTACLPVSHSAHASGPQAASLSPTGVTAWPPCTRLQVLARERRQKGLGSRPLCPKEVFTEPAESRPACTSPQRTVRASSAPPPHLSRPQLHSTCCPGRNAPSSPQCPVAGRQLALGG